MLQYLSYDSLKEQLGLIISATKDHDRREGNPLERVKPLKVMFQRHLEAEVSQEKEWLIQIVSWVSTVIFRLC